jgi:hypothetical protein
LAYHLAFPKIYLQAGSFLRLPWSINAHYPLHQEMWNVLFLLWGDDWGARLASAWNGLYGLSLLAHLDPAQGGPKPRHPF